MSRTVSVASENGESGWKQGKKAEVILVKVDGGSWEQVASFKPPRGPGRTRWVCGDTVLALWEDTPHCQQMRISLGWLGAGGRVHGERH